MEPDAINPAVPESPCTLIFTQDNDPTKELYPSPLVLPSTGQRMDPLESNPGTPSPSTLQLLPTDYGYSFASWVLSDTLRQSSQMDEDDDDDEILIERALAEMKHDWASIPDAVVVACGPWHCWMTQFYLESLPLAGLILIDPIPVNDDNNASSNDISLWQQFYHQYPSLKGTLEYRLFQQFLLHYDHWTLRLEPGSVPMMVISTLVGHQYHEAAQRVALRHSEGASKEQQQRVPLVRLVQPNKGVEPNITIDHANQCLEIIFDWVDHSVL